MPRALSTETKCFLPTAYRFKFFIIAPGARSSAGVRIFGGFMGEIYEFHNEERFYLES
jgi:hypothetical protein